VHSTGQQVLYKGVTSAGITEVYQDCFSVPTVKCRDITSNLRRVFPSKSSSVIVPLTLYMVSEILAARRPHMAREMLPTCPQNKIILLVNWLM
jgi:hypothetical protein